MREAYWSMICQKFRISNLSIYISIFLFIHLSIYLSIYVFSNSSEYGEIEEVKFDINNFMKAEEENKILQLEVKINFRNSLKPSQDNK